MPQKGHTGTLRRSPNTKPLMLKILQLFQTRNRWHRCLYNMIARQTLATQALWRGAVSLWRANPVFVFLLPVVTKLPLHHQPPVVSHWASTSMDVTPTPESCWARSTRRYSRSHCSIHLPSLDLWLWADPLSSEGGERGACAKQRRHSF